MKGFQRMQNEDFCAMVNFQQLVVDQCIDEQSVDNARKMLRRTKKLFNLVSMDKIWQIDERIINDFERSSMVDQYQDMCCTTEYQVFIKKAKSIIKQLKVFSEKQESLRIFGMKKSLRDDKKRRQLFFESNVLRKDDSQILEAIQRFKDVSVQKLIYQNYQTALKDKGSDGVKYMQWVEQAMKVQATNEQDFEMEVETEAEEDAEKVVHAVDSGKKELLVKIISQFADQIHSMHQVKKKLVCILNQKLDKWDDSSVLGLCGPPGIGKTTLFEVISKVLDIPCTFISMTGITDSHYLTGHNFTYVGSQPGVIARTIIKHQNKRQIIFLDEVDKVSNSNIKNVLISLLDPQQNCQFQDHYFQGLKIDLSQTWFILTMNDKHSLGPILQNRIEMIDVPGYGDKDKRIILRDYIMPKQLETLGLQDMDSEWKEKSVDLILKRTQKEDGMRLAKAKLYDFLVQVKLRNSFKDPSPDSKTILEDPRNNYLKDILEKQEEQLVSNDNVYTPSIYI